MRISRQDIKEAAPWLVHASHLYRRASNQVRYPVVASAIELRSRGRVMGGPFEGLRAPHSGISPDHYAQLLGVYEKALVPVIEAVIARQPAVIVDVGSHWGYYALGLAMRCPRSRVVAFEMEPWRAQMLRRYSRLNGVEERIEIRGACTTDHLADVLADLSDPFLLMDVEGAEDVLLDPARVPGLRHTEIVVELHDIVVPGVTARLLAAFAPTHHTTLLQHENPDTETVVTGPLAAHRLLRRTAKRLLDEHRDAPMSWLHLRPNG